MSAAASAGDRVAVAVTGPKGSGKSAFCRLLCNTLLNQQQQQSDHTGWSPKVALLDVDPGQPELTPPVRVVLIAWCR